MEYTIRLIDEYKKYDRPSPFIIQVGSSDGITGNPFHRLLADNQLHGILIEPIPWLFEDLKKTYRDCCNLTLVNCAIGLQNGICNMVTVDVPAATAAGVSVPDEIKGMSTFYDMPITPEMTKSGVDKYIRIIQVECRTLQSILDEYHIHDIDILSLDVNGFEYNIMIQLSFDKFKPRLIQYGILKLLTSADYQMALDMLSDEEYCVTHSKTTITATYSLSTADTLIISPNVVLTDIMYNRILSEDLSILTARWAERNTGGKYLSIPVNIVAKNMIDAIHQIRDFIQIMVHTHNIYNIIYVSPGLLITKEIPEKGGIWHINGQEIAIFPSHTDAKYIKSVINDDDEFVFTPETLDNPPWLYCASRTEPDTCVISFPTVDTRDIIFRIEELCTNLYNIA